MRRQDQQLVSFYLKQTFVDRRAKGQGLRAKGGGRLIAISWWSIWQQAQDAGYAAENEVHTKSKGIMQACNHHPKINQFVHRRKRNEMQELVIY